MPAKFRHHFANLSTFAPLSNLLLFGLRSAISPSSSIGLFLLSDVDELLPSSARRRTTQSKMDKLTSNDRIVQTSFPKSKTLYSNQPKIFNMIDLLNIGGQLHGRSAITFKYLNKRHTFFSSTLYVLAVYLRLCWTLFPIHSSSLPYVSCM